MSRHFRQSAVALEVHSSPYLSQVSEMVDPRRLRIRLSRELPSWLWRLLAYSLSLMPDEGPVTSRLVVGTTLYVLTLASAVTFMSANGFFLVFDIISDNTKSTVFTGTADVLLVISWVSLGTFANHLAYRVLTTRALASNIYLHSRKILRINSGTLIFVVAVGGIIAHMYNYVNEFEGNECKLVGLYPFVCKMTYVSGCIYAFMAIYWNLIVAWFVLSVCRTHTIDCRRFVRDLEFEGTVLEKIYALKSAKRVRQLVPSQTHVVHRELQPSDFMQEVETDEENHSNEQGAPPVANSDEENSRPNISDQELLVVLRNTASTAQTPIESPSPSTPTSDHSPPDLASVNLPEMFRRLEESHSTDIDAFQRLLFSCEDLCMRYWRIGCQMRITSLVFQRWMATWMSFVAIWTLSYIVYWLKQKATFLDLLDFFVPVLLIGFICSAYAEVNLECVRISESICPQPDRLYFNRFLISRPIYLTVYSMQMTYQVIAGFIAAFAIAFISRIVMDEFDKGK